MKKLKALSLLLSSVLFSSMFFTVVVSMPESNIYRRIMRRSISSPALRTQLPSLEIPYLNLDGDAAELALILLARSGRSHCDVPSPSSIACDDEDLMDAEEDCPVPSPSGLCRRACDVPSPSGVSIDRACDVPSP